MWDSLECKGFVKILAFAFEKDLMENNEKNYNIQFLNERENLGFIFVRDFFSIGNKYTFFLKMILMQKNKDKKWDLMRVDNEEKQLILKSLDYLDPPKRFLEITNRYNTVFTGQLIDNAPIFRIFEVPKAVCELINNGYKFSKKKRNCYHLL